MNIPTIKIDVVVVVVVVVVDVVKSNDRQFLSPLLILIILVVENFTNLGKLNLNSEIWFSADFYNEFLNFE